jgi:hypothetical protein
MRGTSAVSRSLEDTRLDTLYRDLFLQAKRSVKQNSRSTYTGVRVVLFGTFYIEALLNRLVKDLLFDELKEEKHAAQVWRAIEKTNIISKLSVVLSSTPRYQEKMNDYLAKARRILDQRNRLVHSKDEDRTWMDVFKGIGLKGQVNRENIPARCPPRGLKSSVVRDYVRSTEELEKVLNDLARQRGTTLKAPYTLKRNSTTSPSRMT